MFWYFWELIVATIFKPIASMFGNIGRFLLWLVVCGLPAMIVYIFHCLLICPRFVRQIKGKTKDDLDTPLFTLTELLMFWPVIAFSR
jgi:hypothetical protein